MLLICKTYNFNAEFDFRLLKMGALDADKVMQGGEQWRIVTCMWLHAGVFHIFANMLSLLGVGIRLEQEFGFGEQNFLHFNLQMIHIVSSFNSNHFLVARIGCLYVVSGLGGSLLSTLFIRKSISVGASGALFGLLGAMLSELVTNWTIYANKVRIHFRKMVGWTNWKRTKMYNFWYMYPLPNFII